MDMSVTVERETAISIDGLRKSFAGEPVLRGIDLSIDEGDFCVVVGSSGSGKSTLLKCISGLLSFERGAVFVDGEDVTNRSVEARDIGFVFQDFEDRLFPHMTVEENVAFGLREAGTYDAEEISRRVDETLQLLSISETKTSLPSELSGGQQQRVELARQLVRECDVMLLDDPLADLDYKLQKRMVLEIRRIHEEFGSTFVYVTHNQDQALKLADKLVVMNDGVIEQVGTPEEVYDAPETAFVGRFIGDNNPLLGTVTEHDGDRVVIDTDLGSVVAESREQPPSVGEETMVLLRPEDVALGDDADACDNGSTGTVEDLTYTGEYTEFAVSFPNVTREFQVRRSGDVRRFEEGDEIRIGWDAAEGVCYDRLSASDSVTVDDLMEV